MSEQVLNPNGIPSLDQQSGDETVEAPTVGYTRGVGGINNQKMGIIGLISFARERKICCTLPQIFVFDQMSRDARSVAFADVFDFKAMIEAAALHGVTVRDREHSEESVFLTAREKESYGNLYGAMFWRTRNLIEHRIFEKRDGDALSFVQDIVTALQPNVTGSFFGVKFFEKVFEDLGIQLVVQMRIEADWFRHCEKNLRPRLTRAEDISPSHIQIMDKIVKSISGVKKLYVVCDEPALTVTKDTIKLDILKNFGVDVFFKSDILSQFDFKILTPLHLSLLDFETAIRAKQFVGMSRSTFSNMTTFEKIARERNETCVHWIYNTSGELLSLRTDGGCSTNPYKATSRQRMDASQHAKA